jgi:hypothetical protein
MRAHMAHRFEAIALAALTLSCSGSEPSATRDASQGESAAEPVADQAAQVIVAEVERRLSAKLSAVAGTTHRSRAGLAVDLSLLTPGPIMSEIADDPDVQRRLAALGVTERDGPAIAEATARRMALGEEQFNARFRPQLETIARRGASLPEAERTDCLRALRAIVERPEMAPLLLPITDGCGEHLGDAVVACVTPEVSIADFDRCVASNAKPQ